MLRISLKSAHREPLGVTGLIETQYFTIGTLNVRKQMFNYGEIEIGNISPEITVAHLNRFKLNMTAREMMSFIHLFPSMVGDLVPEDDDVWLFFSSLLEIVDILLSFEIPRPLAERLKFLIEEHHKKYVRFFNDTLKPKHHFMLHYFRVILQSGPPRHYWSFPFEAKHKDFKAYTKNVMSRKNICVSLSKKYQLKFANYLIQPDKPMYSVNSDHIIRSKHNELISSFCNHNQINGDNYRCYSKCTYRSKIYKKGYFISQHVDDICSENSIIYQIVEMVLFRESNSVHLVCKPVHIEKYHKHFAPLAVDVSVESNREECVIMPIEKLSGPPINVHKISRGLNMIRPKQYC